jgi:hypothetical protein
MNRTSTIYVHNRINEDVDNETDPFGGNLINKYISKPITLADGQDAEDLLVTLSAYAPSSTSNYYPVKVWAKIVNNQDPTSLNDREWVELEPKLGENTSIEDLYSLRSTSNDFKEISFGFPTSWDGSPEQYQISDDEIYPGVTYYSNGNKYTGFKQYQIKIGLLGFDTSIVPKVADLKTIALQM